MKDEDKTKAELIKELNFLREERGKGVSREITECRQAMTNHRDRYDDLFCHISSGVAMYEAKDKGKDFIIKDFNPAAEKIDQVKKEDIIDKSVLKIFPAVKDFGLFKVFQEVYQTGKSQYFPISFYQDQRISGWRENHVYKLSSGEIMVVYKDITERKQAEGKLQDSEEYLKILFDYAPDAYYINNLKGNFIDGNKAAEKLTGYKREELIGKNFLKLKLLSLTDILKAAKLLVKNLRRQPTGPDEFVLNRKDNSKVTVEISTYPIKIKSRILVLGIARDITERKKNEEILQIMVEMLDAAPSGILIHDFNGRVLYANRKISELHGYEADEFMVLNLHQLVAPESKELIEERMHLIKEKSETSFEVSHIRKDGTAFPLNVIVKLVKWHETSAILSINTDISRRKEIEESLRKSQQEFESLFYSNPEALVYLDENNQVLNLNPRFTELFGYTLEEVKGRDINEGFIHPPDKIEEGKKLTTTRSKGHLNFETMRKKKDGTLFSVSISATPLLIDGQFKGEIGLYIDISERIKLQNTLQESEEKFYSISASALDAIFFIDPTGSITYCNQAAEKMFGYDEKEILGKDLHQMIVPVKYHPAFKKGFLAFQETGEGPALGKTWELSALKKTGAEFPVALSLSAVKLKGAWNAIGIIRDISSQKEAEEKLEKLARTDALTGSYSRGYGLELLDRQMKLSHRSKSSLLLAFLDIDRFKSINDTYGHDEGDLVLKEVVKLFKSTLREIDIICRMGGDEFLLIFPDNSLKEAPLIKERLDKDLFKLNQTLKKPYKIDLSIGLSEYDPAQPLVMDELIRIADQKMYEEKKKKK